MPKHAPHAQRRADPILRIAFWGGAALLLSVPLVAMRFTDEVAWDGRDFLTFGTMLGVACGACELVMRVSRDLTYRAAAGLGVATAFFLVWANLAVGIIGSEDNPANLLHYGVLAIGIAGAAIVRGRAHGMALVLAAMAGAQLAVAAIAAVGGWGSAPGPTALFAGLWLASAALFRTSSRHRGVA